MSRCLRARRQIRMLALLLAMLVCGKIAAQQPELVLLRPTGENVDGLVEMELIPETSILALKIHEIVENSVIDKFLRIHEIMQVYLANTRGYVVEPAYLALTQNQGGYARQGFVIKSEAGYERKSHSFYVDINESTVRRDFRSLMSITQLYPHELGHIMYRLLCSSDSLSESSKNIDVHFFSVTTDYLVAFNEGFAEHLENIARLFEGNQEVTAGIKADTIEIVRRSKRSIRGFTRDFKNPWRFGFYKMSMLAWYQPFEDYKRFSYPLNGWTKYANASISSSRIQHNLIYRNSGVAYDRDVLRNQVQQMATEGTISSFFTQLSLTDVKNRYRPEAFYRPFLQDTNLHVDPSKAFTPLENLFTKYFYALDRYVTFEQTEKTHLIDFIDGYQGIFPEDSDAVLRAYELATGMEYHNQVPPELWILVKDRSHGILAMDAFAGLSMPFYTFELNAAEREDLMMIEGVSEEDAEAIVDHRETHGFFHSLDELNRISALSDEGRWAVTASEFDQSYFNEQEFPETLSIRSVLMAPLKRLAAITLIGFVLIMILYFYLTRKVIRTGGKKLGEATGYLILWIILILYGLVASANSWHWSPVLIPGILVLVGASLVLRKIDRNHLLVIGLMTSFILLSLI